MRNGWRAVSVGSVLAMLVVAPSCVMKKDNFEVSARWTESSARVEPATINDFAGLLLSGTRRRVAAMLREFNARAVSRRVQITVVTETSPLYMLTTESVNAFSNATRRHVEKGTSQKHIVLAIVVAPQMTNKSIFGISRDDSLIRDLPNAVSSQILNQMNPLLQNGDEDRAILLGTRALIEAIAQRENISVANLPNLNPWYDRPWYILVFIGITAAITLIWRSSRVRKIGGRVLTTLLWWTCIGLWATWIYLTVFVYNFNPAVALSAMYDTAKGVWPPTDDGVLNFIIGAVAALPLLIVGGGTLYVGFWICVGLIALAFVIAPLEWLAQTSRTGAAIALLIILMGLWLMARKYWLQIRKVVLRVAEPLFGIFFDWWITPIIRRRKEKRVTKDLRQKRDQCATLVLKLQAEYPEAVTEVQGGSISSDTWLERVIERFEARDRQKSITERTKLVTLARRYFAEYRSMLDAQHELSLADRDADIRVLERKKKELSLKSEIEELEKGSEFRAETRNLEQEKQKLALESELEQLRKKKSDANDAPFRAAMKNKQDKRRIDFEDELFEALERPSERDIQAKLLFKQMRQKIDRHPGLSDDDKDELQERLKRRFIEQFKSISTAIFEED